MQMQYFPAEILYNIFDDLNIYDKVSFRKTCRYLYNILQISALPRHIKITDEIIKYNPRLTEVIITTPIDISSLKYLKVITIRHTEININFNDFSNLRELYIEGNINTNTIENLPQLKHLMISGSNIRTISDLPNLEHLSVAGTTLQHIKNLPRLKTLLLDGPCKKELVYDYTPTIENTPSLERYIASYYNTMPTLENVRTLNLKSIDGYFTCNYANITTLIMTHMNKLADHDIAKFCNLRKLVMNDNISITNLNALTKLEILTASGTSALTNDGIKNLCNIRRLNISGNKNITVIRHMIELLYLDISHSYVTDNELCFLPKLKYINVTNNNSTTSLNMCPKLTNVVADRQSSLTNEGISCLTKLETLSLIDNRIIMDLTKITSLTSLNLVNNRKITNEMMPNSDLKSLYISNNLNISDLNRYSNLEELHANNNQLLKDGSINKLDKLIRLDICDSTNIHNIVCNSIENLDISGKCGVVNIPTKYYKSLKPNQNILNYKKLLK